MGDTIIKDVEIPDDLMTADNTSYDNSNTSLEAETVQEAIDKLDEKIESVGGMNEDIQQSIDDAYYNANKYTDQKIAEVIGSADSTMDTLEEVQKAMTDNADVVEALNNAIGSKANQAEFDSHVTDINNPHNVKASQLTDLAKVATSGSYNDLSNKPTIPTKMSDLEQDVTLGDTYDEATSTEAGLMSATDKAKLDGIQAGADAVAFAQALTSGTKIGVLNINGVDIPIYAPTNTDTTYSAATQSAPGLMSAADKKKLDGIQSDADAVAFSQKLTSGTVVGTLTINGTNITLYAPTNTDTTYGVVSSGANGLCPALPGGSTKFLRGDGSWAVPPDTNTIYSAATQSANGLMSAADKKKLDGIQSDADAVSVAQSLTSGTQVGTITINGVTTKLYAPTPVTSAATTSNAGLMSAADKKKLDGIQASADAVAFAQALTSGTKIGTLTINGTAITLYAPTNTDTTYGVVSTAANGLMSAADKKKLDGIEVIDQTPDNYVDLSFYDIPMVQTNNQYIGCWIFFPFVCKNTNYTVDVRQMTIGNLGADIQDDVTIRSNKTKYGCGLIYPHDVVAYTNTYFAQSLTIRITFK